MDKNKSDLNLVRNEYLYMSDYNQVINACVKDMFMENGDNRRIPIRGVHIDEGMIKKRIKKLSQLVFESTQNCNIRCKYCVYNGHYSNQRNVTPREMNFETAKKGMDYIFSIIKNRKKKEFALSFYGGEPLLNVKIIKEIVEYAKKRFTGWGLRYNMTTNLTLLDDSILDFLVENNFSLMVSLDGGRENHDAKRVFVNGKGTHDIVLRNLEKIEKQYTDYFLEKVSFSAVYSFDLPLKNLYKFYTGSDLVKKKRMRFGGVNAYNTTYYEKYPYSKETFDKEFKEIFSRVLEKVLGGDQLIGFETFLYNNFKEIGDSLNFRDYSLLGGACLFDERLYLDARGRFHICEKMNNAFSFGDVDRGFDFKKMADIVREYIEVTKTHCLDCNLRFLCKRCFVSFAGNGRFEVLSGFCKNQEESIVSNLERYIEYKEEGKKTALKMNVKKFHQFAAVEKGPVNAAVIDLLKGNVYQVENKVIDTMAKGAYEEIPGFMESAEKEGLIIEINEKNWIPSDEDNRERAEDKDDEIGIELHVEEGIDPDAVIEKFGNHAIRKVFFYGGYLPQIRRPGVQVVKKEKDFHRCVTKACVDGKFGRITESAYLFNKMYNSCWGRKVAVTKDGKVRPCIHSSITSGDIEADDIDKILEKMKEYWIITKDKVEKCKDCELRYACFDCREMAFRECGDLFAANPVCNYDPYKGTWK